MYPQFLGLHICLFTSGKPMTCTSAWIPATPPSAMRSVLLGPAARTSSPSTSPFFASHIGIMSGATQHPASR